MKCIKNSMLKSKLFAKQNLLSLFSVDLSRVPVYLAYRSSEIYSHLSLILVLVVSALIGARVGKRWLKSLKSELIRNGVMIGIILSGALYLLEAAS